MDVDPRQYENIAVNENDIQNLVFSYLVHNCFKDTTESFIACTGMKQPADLLDHMEKRKGDSFASPLWNFSVGFTVWFFTWESFKCSGPIKSPNSDQKLSDNGFTICIYLKDIYHCALDGNASKAIELTEESVPGLLEGNKDLHFDLLSLCFVELVCSRKSADEVLEFVTTKLAAFGKEQKYVKKLEDLMPLLAFEEPEKSPMFHLLSLEYRQHIADSLNRAILAHTNLPSYSLVERLVQQTTVVRQCLSQESGKDGHQSFSLTDFLKS